MRKMELIDVIKREGLEVKIYGNGFYKLAVRTNESLKPSIKSYDVKLDENCTIDNLPSICISQNLEDYSVEKVGIATVSYGYLTVEDVKKIVENYNIVIKTVEDIEELIGLK